MKETTRICFVRHGETDWNIEQRMQGQTDLALNATGEAQALALGKHFAGQGVAALYSSDLLRARQTARRIAEALVMPVTTLTALRERHFGMFEGMTLEEIAAEGAGGGNDYRGLEDRDPEFVPPGGGESLLQFRRRVLDCIGRLVSEHPGENIVLVTHGGVLDIINRRARGLTLESPRDFEIPNTGINRVSINNRQWVIERWGDTTHLE